MYGRRTSINAQVGYEYPQQPYYLDPELSMLFPKGPVIPSIRAQRGVGYGDPFAGANYGIGLLSAAAGVLGIGVKLWGAKTDAEIKRAQAAAAIKRQEAEMEADAANQKAFMENLPLIIGAGTIGFVALLSFGKAIAGLGRR